MTLIAGMGSSQEADSIGWRVIDALRSSTQRTNATITKLGDPSQLLAELPKHDRLMVIDACRSGVAVGTVHQIVWPDPRLLSSDTSSTHGLGLIATLQLAEKLGYLPKETTLLLIEIGTGSKSDPSPLVLDRLVIQITWQIRQELEVNHHA